MTITYTFPADCPIKELAGKTLTGGNMIKHKGEYVVDFGEQAGRRVMVVVDGKPELEALLAARNDQQAQRKASLTALGWDIYQPLQRAYSNACGAHGSAMTRYNSAVEGSYPAPEVRILAAAENAIIAARVEFPGAAAYDFAQRFCQASNDAKASAGHRTVKAIEAGADPLDAIKAMKSEWSAAAATAVDNY